MEKTAKQIDTQVQFWTLIGPILVVMTLLAILVKGDPSQWLLTLAAISGIPLCWKWKRQGFFLAIGMLAILCSYQMATVPLEERFWVIALSMTIAAAFVVTALSLEEAKEIIKGLEIESKSRLDNLFQLDEKYKESQSNFQRDHELLISKIKRSQIDAEEKQQQVHSLEQLVNVIRSEILEAHENQQKLLQVVFDKKHETALLQQKLDALQQQLSVADHPIKEELATLQTQLDCALGQIPAFHQQMEMYVTELNALKEINEIQDTAASQAQEEQILQQAIIQEMNEHVERLAREKSLLENTLTRLQTELESQANHTQTLKATLETLQEHIRCETTEKEALTQQLADYQNLQEKFTLLQTQMHSITQEKESILQELNEKRSQLQSSPKSPHPLPFAVHDERSVARAQAMYAQLRQQFEEKSTTLDATRKELFHTQEKLLRLQKEIDEIHLYEINDSEAKLQDFLISMEHDLSHKEHEVQALHDLISSLICK